MTVVYGTDLFQYDWTVTPDKNRSRKVKTGQGANCPWRGGSSYRVEWGRNVQGRTVKVAKRPVTLISYSSNVLC